MAYYRDVSLLSQIAVNVPETSTHSSASKIGYFHCHVILKYYTHFSRAYIILWYIIFIFFYYSYSHLHNVWCSLAKHINIITRYNIVMYVYTIYYILLCSLRAASISRKTRKHWKKSYIGPASKSNLYNNIIGITQRCGISHVSVRSGNYSK